MIKKTLLYSTALLGMFMVGTQGVNADTSDTSASAVVSSMPTDMSVSSSSNDMPTDTTNVENNDVPTDTTTAPAETPATPAETPAETPTDVPTDTTTVPAETPTTPVETPAEAPADVPAETPATSTDVPAQTTGQQELPTNGVAPVVVPLTDTTPDINEQGQLTQVAPVQVQAPVQGQDVAPVVPNVVASVPSVARAVQKYNEVLAQNGSNADSDQVKEAKKNVDEAVKQALPKTGEERKVGTNSFATLGTLFATMFASAGLLYKKFANK